MTPTRSRDHRDVTTTCSFSDFSPTEKTQQGFLLQRQHDFVNHCSQNVAKRSRLVGCPQLLNKGQNVVFKLKFAIEMTF